MQRNHAKYTPNLSEVCVCVCGRNEFVTCANFLGIVKSPTKKKQDLLLYSLSRSCCQFAARQFQFTFHFHFNSRILSAATVVAAAAVMWSSKMLRCHTISLSDYVLLCVFELRQSFIARLAWHKQVISSIFEPNQREKENFHWQCPTLRLLVINIFVNISLNCFECEWVSDCLMYGHFEAHRCSFFFCFNVERSIVYYRYLFIHIFILLYICAHWPTLHGSMLIFSFYLRFLLSLAISILFFMQLKKKIR